MNLLITSEKTKSNAPKNTDTAIVKPSTIRVYLKTSFLESQLTLFNSTQTSLKNMFIFCIVVMFLFTLCFKKRPFAGHQVHNSR